MKTSQICCRTRIKWHFLYEPFVELLLACYIQVLLDLHVYGVGLWHAHYDACTTSSAHARLSMKCRTLIQEASLYLPACTGTTMHTGTFPICQTVALQTQKQHPNITMTMKFSPLINSSLELKEDCTDPAPTCSHARVQETTHQVTHTNWLAHSVAFSMVSILLEHIFYTWKPQKAIINN